MQRKTSHPDRRSLLKLMGAAGLSGALLPSIARALAVPAQGRKGTIEDVEHIVILTQENRSFDHMFGCLRGVRGFADPRAVRLPSGKPVWHQPDGQGELLPFRPALANLGLSFLPDLPHGWNDTHAAWNGGRHDQWVPSKGRATMTHHTREDIPYHYALADAFTVCDAYHCSLLGPTDPNRYHLWTGWVGNDSQQGGPVVTNAEAGYDWTTFPERLLKAGIAWKVYQDIGQGLDAAGLWGGTEDPYVGNYGDNSLLYFNTYRQAQPDSPLFDAALTGTRILAHKRDPKRLLDRFREDVSQGRLPAVSWIVAPEAFSEHPNHPTGYGAWYSSQVIDILAAHPDVFGKTVLFINYDEEGGFFDHMVPPTPPFEGLGASTVDVTHEIYAGGGDPRNVSGPYGLGMRVPMLVISPWSKGGWVNSQVFDHTSLIRFIETRYAKEHPELLETNITPWRRAVCGDLTSTLDFSLADTDRVRLPSTTAFAPAQLKRQPSATVVPPAEQGLPAQERGIRPARALPYALHAEGAFDSADGRFHIRFGNTGRATAVLHVRSGDAAEPPRSFTIEPGKQLTDAWSIGDSAGDLSVHGPNGFLRSFKGLGGNAATRLQVSASYDAAGPGITLSISNRAEQALPLEVRESYRNDTRDYVLEPGQGLAPYWPLQGSGGWYDLTLKVPGDPGTEIRLAGHVETGAPSISDPAMG
ncbi:MAG TPA: phospholipase C, phosphocholine-specific [Burkholderiaceae bacterium]|jgi:phospholipase C